MPINKVFMYHLIVGVRIEFWLQNSTNNLQFLDFVFLKGVVKYTVSKGVTHIFKKILIYPVIPPIHPVLLPYQYIL